MNRQYFTEEDRLEALNTSGTGMWKLEAGEGMHTRFYGDSIMNMLLGVPDDMSPEDRYDFFFEHVCKEDMGMFMEYYKTLKAKAKAEVVYRYEHPTLGTIYVRCGGKRSYSDGKMVCYRGFHQNVDNTIRVEQETRSRLTRQAETYRSVAFQIMENFSDASAKINLETGDFEWYTFDGDESVWNQNYNDVVASLLDSVPEEYREDFIADSAISTIKAKLETRDIYTYSTFVRRSEEDELSRVSYWYYKVKGEDNFVLSVYRDTTIEYEKEKQLADALLAAKQANKAKTNFLNNMSHDIRTPMNAIIGFTELARKYYSDEERCLDYLQKIKTSSNHLLTLINDVLDMSRIESGRMVFSEEPCSIAEIMENMNTILQTDARNKGLEFEVNYSDIKDTDVVCDKLRLNQVLLNCASNSIKFTNEGGRVSIAVQQIDDPYTPEGRAEYRFIIEDTGIGMSEEFLTKVFEPFSREENTVHSIQGTGLGMAICKNIVDMMGGTIEVKSKQGVGTRFTINLKLELAGEISTDEGIESLDMSILANKQVLLAEDNELNREIACEILGEAGMTVEVAVNGKEAVDMIQASAPGHFDLVLMDIQMPVMNGYEATRAIRELTHPDAGTLKILAMTANAFEEDKRNALDAGMNGHLAKPIDINEMLKTMADLMA